MNEQITSTLRVRIGQEEAHYGGNLVEGHVSLKLFGDIITEIAIVTGDEGLFVGYDKIEFLAPLYAGDFVEATGRVIKIGTTSRTVEFEAHKVIAARYDQSPSGADVLDKPQLVVRAVGTTVVPADHSRGSKRCGSFRLCPDQVPLTATAY
jgi:3-aminobutyryl-CoA ammonia-lyase